MPYPHGKANPRSIGICLLRVWADSPNFPTKNGGEPVDNQKTWQLPYAATFWRVLGNYTSESSQNMSVSLKGDHKQIPSQKLVKTGELPLFKWDLATNQWGLALASVWWALVVPLDNVEGKISRLEAPFWWLSTRDTGDWEACIQALFIGSSWGGGTWEFLGLSQPRHLEIARLLMHKVQLKPVEIWLKHNLKTLYFNGVADKILVYQSVWMDLFLEVCKIHPWIYWLVFLVEKCRRYFTIEL